MWTVSQFVSKYLCVDIRRRRVVLLFCLVGVCVCLGKVPPCVAVNQYIFSLPLAQIPALRLSRIRWRGRGRGRNAEEAWGKECWGN